MIPCDDIKTAIEVQLDQNENLAIYILFDPAASESLPGELFLKEEQPDYHLLFMETEFSKLVDASPYLVNVSFESSFLEWCIEQAEAANNHLFPIIYLSSHSIENQLTHWRSLLKVNTPEGEAMLFRFADPRILFTYLGASKPEQQQLLLGPVEALYIQAEANTWFNLNNVAGADFQLNPELTMPWLKLTNQQIEAFEIQAQLNLSWQIVQHLKEQHMDLVEEQTDHDLQEMTYKGLQKAAKYGLTDEVDLISFVVMMFVVAPNFAEQPAIKARLTDESIPEDERFEYMVESTTEEEWEAAVEAYDIEAWD
ncbi:DUF4123 domain-containing protein [Spartinivicinus poritis]|uniref:DUF4123 domain-containing protein n=1 Tax=Spartinivicinus poritis TaxID=2994640 RepID=A0ABT5UGH0_9GAMM|nr:DUF4123 domain-containing protein [Spartinivicinus sp. A2-2]MDE1465483.1 DUF4123 domain-containing protein [Spartinivicinus sp. A2-2]